jgi:hypothetical protein
MSAREATERRTRKLTPACRRGAAYPPIYTALLRGVAAGASLRAQRNRQHPPCRCSIRCPPGPRASSYGLSALQRMLIVTTVAS